MHPALITLLGTLILIAGVGVLTGIWFLFRWIYDLYTDTTDPDTAAWLSLFALIVVPLFGTFVGTMLFS